MDQQQHCQGCKQQHEEAPRHHAGLYAGEIDRSRPSPSAQEGQARGQGDQDQGQAQRHGYADRDEKSFRKPLVVGLANQQPSVNQGHNGSAEIATV